MNNLLDQISNKSIYQNFNKNLTYSDVTWKTQDSSKSHILFYKLNNLSDKSIELFKQRLNECQYALVITNKRFNTIEEIPNILVVSDWLEVQKRVLDELYPMPVDVKIVAVTGTNGKTTCVDLMSQICCFNKIDNITIGTLGLLKNRQKILDFGLTTPSYIDFRKYLNIYGKEVKFFFVEASSHALEQNRFYKINFDVSGWTSFSQDHLDYHKDMQSYFAAKCKIIDQTSTNKVFISSRSVKLINKLDAKLISSCDPYEGKIRNPFFKADYNLINFEVAFELLKSFKIYCDNDIIEKLSSPPGRFEIIEYGNSYVVIDFAHTPDALENICNSLKKSFPGFELVTLFGCGGDRDKTKRPLMAKACEKYSQKLIITSDNPRFEEPESIIADIVKGIEKIEYKICVDRKEAINLALKNLNKSILLIAGKGHENYLDIKGVKNPYSDEKVVREFISDQIS